MVTDCSHSERASRRTAAAMAGSSKVIITCALTGSGHTPSMSPHLPYTIEQVVDQGVAAAEAGAAVLHLHARNPKDGSPTADPGGFAEYAKGIRQRSDLICIISPSRSRGSAFRPSDAQWAGSGRTLTTSCT